MGCRRAAERVLLTADEAIQVIKSFISDPTVPAGFRLKAAQDLADRAGLAAAQVHKIVPTTEDPVIAFFEGAFSDPGNWVSNPQPDPTPAIESYAISSLDRRDVEPEEIVEAEIVEPEGEPANDTPLRIAEMIKSGVFDRKAGE